MRTFIIITMVFTALRVMALLYLIAKLEYPRTVEKTRVDDACAIFGSVLWFVSGLIVMFLS